MKQLITLLIVSLLYFTVYAQTVAPECQSHYYNLESLAKKNVATLEDLSSALETTKILIDLNCPIDDFPVTSTMGDLIIKADNPNAVSYFMEYRKLMPGSVEEELSFSFYRIYEKYPEKVLEIVSLRPDYSTYKERLISDLGCGFKNINYIDLSKTGLSFKEYYFSKLLDLNKLVPLYGQLIERIIKASEFEE